MASKPSHRSERTWEWPNQGCDPSNMDRPYYAYVWLRHPRDGRAPFFVPQVRRSTRANRPGHSLVRLGPRLARKWTTTSIIEIKISAEFLRTDVYRLQRSRRDSHVKQDRIGRAYHVIAASRQIRIVVLPAKAERSQHRTGSHGDENAEGPTSLYELDSNQQSAIGGEILEGI